MFTNPLILLVIAFVVMILLVTAVLYIIHLRRKLDNFETPKYGFLGKNIYPLIGFITLGSVILFASFGMLAPDVRDTKADLEVDGRISAQVKSQTLSNVTVSLGFTPYVSGRSWGTPSDKFDIYWEFIGKQTFNKHEFDRSSNNPSSIDITLPKGNYKVKITVVYLDKTFTFNDQLSY